MIMMDSVQTCSQYMVSEFRQYSVATIHTGLFSELRDTTVQSELHIATGREIGITCRDAMTRFLASLNNFSSDHSGYFFNNSEARKLCHLNQIILSAIK